MDVSVSVDPSGAGLTNCRDHRTVPSAASRAYRVPLAPTHPPSGVQWSWDEGKFSYWWHQIRPPDGPRRRSHDPLGNVVSSHMPRPKSSTHVVVPATKIPAGDASIAATLETACT